MVILSYSKNPSWHWLRRQDHTETIPFHCPDRPVWCNQGHQASASCRRAHHSRHDAKALHQGKKFYFQHGDSCCKPVRAFIMDRKMDKQFSASYIEEKIWKTPILDRILDKKSRTNKRGQQNASSVCEILHFLPKCKEKNLHFCKFLWSWWPDSNRRPHPYQGCALPTELHQHAVFPWREIDYTTSRAKMQGVFQNFLHFFCTGLPGLQR